MNEGSITCPNCDHQFELSDALQSQIREQLEGKLKEEFTQREVDLKKRTTALKEQAAQLAKNQESVDELVASELKKQSAQLEAAAAKKLEARYADQLKELQSSLKEQGEDSKRKLAEAETKATAKAKEELQVQLKELQESAAEKDASLKALRDQELELRKKQRELAKEKEEAELAMQRKLDTEREAISKEVTEKLGEQHRLKELEKDQMIRSLKTSVEDMKRKAEQGSMESQGEALEIDLEEQLRQSFPHDEITPVSKGVRGADIVQNVRTPLSQDCGIILWETKNTKTWSDAWLTKFKDDMQEKRAVLGILVSVALPASIKRFGRIDGVWVSDPASALSLVLALREQLLVVNREQLASVGKNEKMEMLYQYLAGTQFQQKITGIVEAFEAMQLQIIREKRAMEKQWKEREKQIERVVKNTVGLYGDMQGIIGGQIPSIPALELDDENASDDPTLLLE
ncbi:MAG: DUF2130 domain-containing protein [Roseibacillus sp.]